jgi:two-component system, NtrC family, response regulator HydG
MSRHGIAHHLIGDSLPARQVIDFIGTVAPKDTTVLIRGESGTGKEMVARAIHENSRRADRLFVALNCAAVPEDLLESELFGFEKGAFTGATVQKKGKIEIADGGTLFLDEIGDMKPSMQVKLLRVLQQREFERLGGLHPIHVDIRLILATHRDLESMVANNEFREDIYYRIRVLSITLAPLRDRKEDIMPLAEHFLSTYAARHNRSVTAISEDAGKLLTRYDWPGNIRELEHAIEAAVVMGSGERILARELPVELVTTPPRSLIQKLQGLKKTKQQVERYVIENALIWAEGSYEKAARLLDIHQTSLYRSLVKFNLINRLKGGVA